MFENNFTNKFGLYKIVFIHLQHQSKAKKIMKTKTAQIDIISITPKGDTYLVEYWDENCENENNATIQISNESLLDHVAATGVNQIGDWELNPTDYLAENLQATIKDYIQFNS